VVLAVYYPDAKAAVEQYGDGLSGKVLVDASEIVDDLPRVGVLLAEHRHRCPPARSRLPMARATLPVPMILAFFRSASE
jgi:hypothetical protein